MGSRQTNPQAVNALCVPAWQQTLQGNCNKMLSGLETNVGSTQTPQWKQWSLSAWLNPNTAWQSTTTYNSETPQAPGISDATYGPNSGSYGGYEWRRAFTFGLANPQGPADGHAWASQALQSWEYKDGTRNGNDATQVACAINTFGQSETYRISTDDPNFNYNGLCYNPSPRQLNRPLGFGVVPSYSKCKISFQGSTFPTKRSIGSFNGWEIESIEMDPEPVVELPEDYEPPADEPLMPFQYAGQASD